MNFVDLNTNIHYYNRYIKFINTIKVMGDRELDCYTETHHIVPRCLGGDDQPENLLVLTLREHFVAHLLLWKSYPNHSGLAFAFSLMAKKLDNYENTTTSRIYEKQRKEIFKKLAKMHENTVRVRDDNGTLIV